MYTYTATEQSDGRWELRASDGQLLHYTRGALQVLALCNLRGRMVPSAESWEVRWRARSDSGRAAVQAVTGAALTDAELSYLL